MSGGVNLPRCELPRPNSDGERQLTLVQTWDAPSGITGELLLEEHGDHVHVWWRWAGYWDEGLVSEDWAHAESCVLPIVRDVVAAFCWGLPLDVGSDELMRGKEQGA